MFNQNVNDDSDGAYMISFGIEFQTEEKARKRAITKYCFTVCAGLLGRGMVCELEHLLLECDVFFCSMSAAYDGAVLLWQW